MKPQSCPCHNLFSTNDQILAALQDSDKTQELISWLGTSTIKFSNCIDDGGDDGRVTGDSDFAHCRRNHYFPAADDTMLSSSKYKFSCPHRVTAAYCILNVIRDSCREILEHQPGQQQVQQAHQSVLPFDQSSSQKSPSSSLPYLNSDNYETSFPSLSSSAANANLNVNVAPNILKTRQKQPKKHAITNSPSILTTVNEINNGSIISSNNSKNGFTATTITTKRRIRPISAPMSESNHALSRTVLSSKSSPIQNLHPTINSKGTNDVNCITNNTTATTKSELLSSPWNQLSLQKNNQSNKLDPMERIMNSREIVSKRSNVRFSSAPLPSTPSTTAFENKCEGKEVKLINTTTTDAITGAQSNLHNQTIANNTKSIPSSLPIVTAEPHESQSTTLPTEEGNEEASSKIIFENIILVYFAIIKYQLIPSMILELQLILRLLCLGDNNTVNSTSTSPSANIAKSRIKQIIINDTNSINNNIINNSSSSSTIIETKLKELFSTKIKCQQFAIQILIKMQYMISNLTPSDILIRLLSLKPFQVLLPIEMIEALHKSVELRMVIMIDQKNHHQTHNHEGGGNLISINGGGIDGNGNASGLILGSMSKTLTLNVSFDEKRDSRHHFRSKDLGTLYNNREQCRGKCHDYMFNWLKLQE